MVISCKSLPLLSPIYPNLSRSENRCLNPIIYRGPLPTDAAFCFEKQERPNKFFCRCFEYVSFLFIRFKNKKVKRSRMLQMSGGDSGIGTVPPEDIRPRGAANCTAGILV